MLLSALLIGALWWLARQERKAAEQQAAPSKEERLETTNPFADSPDLPKNIKDSYVLSDGDVPEEFERWYENRVREDGQPEAVFRTDRGGIPIPSSAQLINEWSVCACGHTMDQHRDHIGRAEYCHGLHDDKPCQCPRFYA